MELNATVLSLGNPSFNGPSPASANPSFNGPSPASARWFGSSGGENCLGGNVQWSAPTADPPQGG